MRTSSALLVLSSLALARPAAAFNERTHEGITRESLRSSPELDASRAPPDAAALARFRAHLYRLLARDPAFTARYPAVEGFDAWAMKEYLALSPEAEVFGIDVLTADALPARDLVARAARQPDEDFRNMSRFAHDERRRILRDARGQPIPADPATLEMGALTGLSSQAHAHYQLAPGPKSDDPAVLKRDPARFALPPDAHTFGARFTQRFFALSAIARAWDDPAAAYLSDLYLGHALHYAQDAASQVHTVQVGIYEFFRGAKIASYREELLSLGGVFRVRLDFRTIGIGILKNHHVVAENLFAKRFTEALRAGEGARSALLVRAREGDQEYDAALAAALHRPGESAWDDAGRIVLLLAERGGNEGPEEYRLVRSVGVAALSEPGFEVKDEDDPDAYVRPGERERLDALYALQARGLGRAASATRALQRLRASTDAASAPRLAAALARDAGEMNRDIERRRAAYRPAAESRAGVNYAVPLGTVGALAVAVLAIRALLRRAARERA